MIFAIIIIILSTNHPLHRAGLTNVNINIVGLHAGAGNTKIIYFILGIPRSLPSLLTPPYTTRLMRRLGGEPDER